MMSNLRIVEEWKAPTTARVQRIQNWVHLKPKYLAKSDSNDAYFEPKLGQLTAGLSFATCPKRESSASFSEFSQFARIETKVMM